ncbi:MAG: N-acetylmuramoyl-L-alanine amidase [Patescibacteria group bacterium]
MKKITFLTLALAVVITTGNLVAVAEINPLAGKIIALDAGHGDTDGAVNERVLKSDGTPVTEAEVNWDVVQALKTKLEISNGAYVVVTERFSTRRDRVNDAVTKCAELDVDGVVGADNRKCDVLVSVHHNGSTDPTHDGTLTIYTQNSDKPLAKALYDSLLPLTNKPEGMLNGGYGMTVYKNLVSTITEAYYITNDDEARLWLSGTRTPEEVDAQIVGLTNYFASQSSGGKGGKPR